MDFVVKNHILYEYIWNYVGPKTNKLDIILTNLKSEHNFNDNQFEQITVKLRKNFLCSYNKKWKSVF